MNPTQFDWSDKAAIRAMVARAEAKGWISRPVLKSPEEELAEQKKHYGHRMRVSPYHHETPQETSPLGPGLS